jgi:PfaB family protein
LDQLHATIENADSLKNIASQTFVKFQQNSDSKYTLSLTGRNQKELIKEINSAKKGVTNAFANGKDWQTPIGSYFTPKPLGKNGEIAFVYPAAVNTYLGIGRSLFRLFPKVLDDVIIKSLDERAADVEKLVFPRSLSKLSTRQLETLEKKLLDDSLAMFEAEVLFTRLISTIITEDFNIKPKYIFGYSLGETSMMVAQGVWGNFYEVSHTFNSSALFGDRLSGSKNAVREYWGLPKTDTNPENKLWANYVLMATPAQVRECLKNETRVYLTQINTPEEVLIAGEPAACERVIKTLGCNSFPAPFDHVIHCQAMQSESQELETLYTLPAQKIPGIKFYSAAEYQSIEIESNQIAHNIATGLCQQLDFPRLVNRVYGDGAKIFIEAGAGGICSRWIDKNLGNQEHLTVFLNRRGTDDHSSLIKALAKLLSHQVNLNLTPLYNLSSENTQQKKAALRKVTLGGNSMTSAILNAENRQIFANNQKQTISTHQEYKIINSLQTSEKIAPTEIYPKPQKNTMKTIMENGLELSKKLKFFESTKIIKQNINQESSGKISMNDLKIAQYQNLSNNTAKLTKTHTSFLAARQDFSQQMSEIIQLQLACAQNLLNEEK